MLRKIINPENVHKPFGYSHAILVDNMLYISGQIPMDINKNLVGVGDMAVQCAQVYENLKRVVEAAGGAMQDIITMNIYTRDLEAFDKSTRDLRKKYFGNYYPVVTAVQISRLYQPESLIEIEATALITDSK